MLFSLFSSKKSKNLESTDYLEKAQSSTFHELFHTFWVLFQKFKLLYPIFVCNISEAEPNFFEMNCLQGGGGIKKKDPGSFFFKLTFGHGLTKYVSRRLSIYGSGFSKYA